MSCSGQQIDLVSSVGLTLDPGSHWSHFVGKDKVSDRRREVRVRCDDKSIFLTDLSRYYVFSFTFVRFNGTMNTIRLFWSKVYTDS